MKVIRFRVHDKSQMWRLEFVELPNVARQNIFHENSDRVAASLQHLVSKKYVVGRDNNSLVRKPFRRFFNTKVTTWDLRSIYDNSTRFTARFGTYKYKNIAQRSGT